jgi:hypothetical protein
MYFLYNYRPKKVTINGIQYMVGVIVIAGYASEKEVPEFGLVTKIVTLPTIFYFQLKQYVAIKFNNHFHAYEVIPGLEPPTLVTSNQFFIHTPMHLVRPISATGRNASSYVVTPYSTTVHS